MPTHLENEATLVAEAQAGNADAFTTLVNQYEQHVYRVAFNITGNKEDAEDVMQQAFLKAYTKLEQFQGNSRFYTWLVRITVNQALMKLRQRRPGRFVSLDEPIANDDNEPLLREIVDWGENPEQRYAQQKLREILAEALVGLEPPLRAVVILRDLEGFSTAEAAAMLNLSVPALKTRLLRGRLKLRKHLGKYFKPRVSGGGVEERTTKQPAALVQTSVHGGLGRQPQGNSPGGATRVGRLGVLDAPPALHARRRPPLPVGV